MMSVDDVADISLFFSFFADEEESVDEEPESSPLVETFRFLHFFFLFDNLL